MNKIQSISARAAIMTMGMGRLGTGGPQLFLIHDTTAGGTSTAYRIQYNGNDGLGTGGLAGQAGGRVTTGSPWNNSSLGKGLSISGVIHRLNGICLPIDQHMAARTVN